MSTIFKATEEQVKTIAALAVNASSPMGLGYLQATDDVFTPDDFFLYEGGGVALSLDYVQGRMVKLVIMRRGEGVYEAFGDVRSDYQSWASAFPTYADLARAAGAEVLEVTP